MHAQPQARPRRSLPASLMGLGIVFFSVLLPGAAALLHAQEASRVPANPAGEFPPDIQQPSTAAPPAAAPPAPGMPAPATPAAQGQSIEPRPIAIVALDSKIPGSAAEVTGALQVFNGRAFIAANGAITSGAQTTQVTLPYRGTLRVCASTTVKLSVDSSVPNTDVPGLMMAMDHGAIEASFATGRNSDILLTPDFRILIGGPGAAEVKVRLGQGGDTCIDNAGVPSDGSSSQGWKAGIDAPYVLVSSVFEGGAYRVQSGQRVMFQHGSLHEVVDQEKEPCGCPPPVKGEGNEFPLAQSEGLAPLFPPAPNPEAKVGHTSQTTETLVYNATAHAPEAASAQPDPAPATTPPAAKPAPKKPNFFAKVGHFFKRLFGAE